MKTLSYVFAAVLGLAFAFGPATDALAKKANKKLSEGWKEEVSKAKLTWKAPKKK